MALRMMDQNRIFLSLIGFLLISGAVFLTSSALYAQPDRSVKTFSAPEKAVKAFVEALKAGEQQDLSALFGPQSVSQLSSGDAVLDRADKEAFLNAYGARNFLEKKGRNRAVLHVGEDDWSFPIPIVKKGKAWTFDFEEGREELLNRRIGRNELRVLQTLEAYVVAQREYIARDWMGSGVHAFAKRLLSSPGKKDGLYWPVKEGEEESPLGPLAAMANREGYKGNTTAPAPFQGYYFRILTAQGENAPGGAYDYVVKENMILGFGLIAYPAKYGSSGVMTFLVNQQGAVYQKDLGKNTAEEAAAIRAYDPDRTWRKVEGTTGGNKASSLKLK
ncbi:Protein of unknown function [Syntrophus gentianae]|uniref:DUF2950 domain-containing protein n=1 Tax=Syntrophus gentianae TaxID=43775 RepID=A0A1H7WNB0_9BACT|nr:DUF2950 domain-containing protein [Syntrophus gentianae]SEM22931.1 Protein of unknown function [Syntrophus gentianae]